MHSPPTFALWIWYRGTRFRGFQRQPLGPTVQQELEQALGRVCHPSGRTDRGVHARMQVVSVRAETFDLDSVRARLPDDLGICAAVPAHRSFHAQWSACGKEYRYRFSLGDAPPAWQGACWEFRVPGFSLARFRELFARAQGRRDFSAFHEKSSPVKPRTLREASVHELDEGIVEARLRGDGFGRYMARYLVGSCAMVACGKISEDDFIAALETARPFRGQKAPPEGLTLWEVVYPGELDPFSAALRSDPPGLPRAPPFTPRA